MRIFLSHATEQASLAETIDLALREEGHTTFFDRSSLPESEAYNAAIREAVQRSDLFVFLLSPEAIAPGRYALTELEFAEKKWPVPVNHVLPVMVSPTPMEVVPPYLRAVTIMRPAGNIAAEVAAAVARMATPAWRRALTRWPVGIAMLVVVGIVAMAWVRFERQRAAPLREAQSLIRAATLQEQAGAYADAWALAERAGSLAPGSAPVATARDRIAMEWLRNVRVVEGKETFTEVVSKLLPALSQCAASGRSQSSADCLAHLGWADFLRSRDGAGGLDPPQYYRRALAMDSSNVFAHAMWAHFLATQAGPLEDIRSHFASALASGRERAFVRSEQLSAYLYAHDPRYEREAIRVANDMRLHAETLPDGPAGDAERWRLWDVYYDWLMNGESPAEFMSALPPGDHLATFRGLFPEAVLPDDKRPLYLYGCAAFEEANGDRAEALRAYQSLKAALERDGASGGRLLDRTNAAIKRLS